MSTLTCTFYKFLKFFMYSFWLAFICIAVYSYFKEINIGIGVFDLFFIVIFYTSVVFLYGAITECSYVSKKVDMDSEDYIIDDCRHASFFNKKSQSSSSRDSDSSSDSDGFSFGDLDL